MSKSKKIAVPHSASCKPQNFIREWRVFRGMPSQGHLAIASGITRATISRLESGKLPYRQWQLDKIAAALHCTQSDLIGTNPNHIASIFQIYARIPVKDRQKALDVIKAFATLPKPAKVKVPA